MILASGAQGPDLNSGIRLFVSTARSRARFSDWACECKALCGEHSKIPISKYSRGGTPTHKLPLRRRGRNSVGHTSCAEMKLRLKLLWPGPSQAPNAAELGDVFLAYAIRGGTDRSKMADAGEVDFSSKSRTLCPSGLRGWTQVPLAQAAWVQIPQVSLFGIRRVEGT